MKMWRTLGISLVVALALLLAVGGSASAMVEKLTIEELTARADSILIGEVTDITCYQEDEGNIYTLVTLSVEQTIKGEPGGEVVIKVLGGEVDGLGLRVSDTPSFQLGERAVVFLEEVDNAFGVSGWYQGKFSVRDNRVVERNQSLTTFMADISQAMEAQGITPKLSVKPASLVLENPVEGKAVEPAKTEEFQVGWQNIMTDDFEGAFPGVWNAFAQGGYTSAYWGQDNFNANSPSNSAFCAKNGTAGVDPPANYPNNMNAWMIYGPFSLADATDAKVDFWLWLESESGYDYVDCMASTNGTNFYGTGWSGSTDWQSMSFDLTNVFTLGDLCGQSQVWIAFIFESDISNTDQGAFVDDVVLQKYVAGGATPQITSISPTWGPAGTGFEVTITGTNFGDTQDTSTVTFWRGGGDPAAEATIVSWSDTEIVCEVPSGASSGNSSNGVRVTTPEGNSNDYPFTVTFSYAERKWPGSNPMGEKYLINPNTADCEGEWQALIDAAQTWNDVDNANFYFEYGGLTTATAGSWDTPNDVNEILWVNYDPGFPSGWIAVNWYWYYPATGEIYESDIVFNDLEFTWDTSGSPSPSQWDVQDTATHELGHSLCLLDLYGAADSEKTMYGFGDPGETKARTLEAEDIAGIQWIYPGTGTWGQYHISVTNNDDDTLTVYFKSDTDADYEDYRLVSVPPGQTLTSFWEVVANGSRQVSIQWTDPDKGTEDFLTSEWLNVPVEGDTEFSFTIPQYPAANTPTVALVSPDSGNQGQTLDVSITGTNLSGATAVSFGAGITINSFSVVFSTLITANITVAAGAALGPRDVSVTTPAGTGALAGGFTVTGPAVYSPFSGTVTIDGVAAPPGTVVDVYVAAETTPRATATTTVSGWYEVLLEGEAEDVGQPVTFMVDGLLAVTTPPTPLFASYSPQTVGLAVSGTTYTLTVTVTPAVGGSVVVDPPGLTYPENTSVTLTATAASGYDFSSWSGDASGTNSVTTVTMTRNKRVTANFTEAPYEHVEIWNCPLGGVVLIAPYPIHGRPFLTVAVDPAEITVSAGAELWGIYYLDETTGEWLYFIPGFTSTLTVLEPDEFYLVVVSDACTLTIPQGT